MKFIYLFATILISITLANGQKTEYLDEYLELTTSKYAEYYRIGTRDFGSQLIGEAKTYRIADSSLFSISNHWKGNLNGVYQLYHQNGELKQIGNFSHGTRTGKWRNYYDNGNTQSELEYLDNFFYKVIEYFSPNGDTLTLDGNGRYEELYPDGTLYLKGSIKDGLKDSFWLIYGEDGTLLHKENYSKGTFESGITFLGNKKIQYNELFKSAEPKGGIHKWHFKLNQESKGSIEGVSTKVRVNFTITENGDLTDVKVINGYNKEVDNKAIELIMKSKKWKPAIKRGIPTTDKLGFSLQF
ncbi:MAG: energy transducer TonB [Bacteroidota bacterium]